ncbi:hypothetical protein ACQPZF_32260 [Actinosynnema sp. CS-041913]|uniref:hypothetical protein n=1 Tax=Actinosynnema sp. CS-041913 TaxID=3239917 RepID=UPI003D926A4D
MNEHELKSALQDAMVASSPPPPMNPEAAVEAGRAAKRRRKATWGGAVAGLAVVAIAVGAVLVPQLTGGAGDGGVINAGGPSTTPLSVSPSPGDVVTVTPTNPSVKPPNPSVTPTAPAGDTSTPWPDGQTDRTASSGPRADKSVRILNDLGSALPPGYQAVDKQPVGERWFGPMRSAQSQFADYYDGDKQVWEYMGTTPVTQQGSSGVGKLWIQVMTKGNRHSSISSPCDAVNGNWPIQGPCEVREVGGKKVGFATGTATGEDANLDQLAVYKHDDGTVVFVGQAREFYRSGHPPLAGPILTPEQLTAQAVDAKYHLD